MRGGGGIRRTRVLTRCVIFRIQSLDSRETSAKVHAGIDNRDMLDADEDSLYIL